MSWQEFFAPQANRQAPVGRAIVDHGRSLQALAAIQSLGRHGVEVIACDETPLMAASFSKYVQETFLHAPLADEGVEAYLDSLQAAFQRYRPEDNRPYVFIPIHMNTTLIAKHRARFEGIINVAAPDYKAILQVDHKDKLVETARRLRVPIPPTWLIHNRQELENSLPELSFPVFLKIPDATGGVGIRRYKHADALLQGYDELYRQFHLSEHRTPLVQQSVSGEDYCVTCLLYRGKLHSSMVYRNLSKYPSEGGFGVVRETVPAEKLVRRTEELLGPLGWHGVAEVDYRWDGSDDSEAYLIEVNPRFWGGLFQSVESGIHYPWYLFQLADGLELDAPGQAVIGTRTKVPLFGALSAIHDAFEDEEAHDQLRQHFEEAMHEMTGGHFWHGLELWVSSLGEALLPGERVNRLVQWFQENHEARSEIFSTDDPLTCLGVFYVLGSLIRRGQLPEELRRSGDERPE